MQEPRSARVAVLGERGVGKSMFLSSLTGCTPAPTAQQPSFAVHAHEGSIMELLECSTHADYAAGRDLLLHGAQAWVVLYSSGSKASLARAREWERVAGARHVPVLLLGIVRDLTLPFFLSAGANGSGPLIAPSLPVSLPLTFALSDASALRAGSAVYAALATLFTRALAKHQVRAGLVESFAMP